LACKSGLRSAIRPHHSPQRADIWHVLKCVYLLTYIRYSKQSTRLAVPNVIANQSMTSVPITVLLYNGPLLCGFNVPIKGLIMNIIMVTRYQSFPSTVHYELLQVPSTRQCQRMTSWCWCRSSCGLCRSLKSWLCHWMRSGCWQQTYNCINKSLTKTQNIIGTVFWFSMLHIHTVGRMQQQLTAITDNL